MTGPTNIKEYELTASGHLHDAVNSTNSPPLNAHSIIADGTSRRLTCISVGAAAVYRVAIENADSRFGVRQLR